MSRRYQPTKPGDRQDYSRDLIRPTVRDAKAKLQRINTAQATIETLWENQLEQTYNTTTWSYSMWEQVRKAAQKVPDPGQAKRLLDQAIFYRLTHSKRGVTTSVDP